MASYLDTSAITDTKQFPVKKGTIDFLQNSHKVDTKEVVRALAGSNVGGAAPIVLGGCVNSGTWNGNGTTGSVITTAGSVMFLGIVYVVPAANFTISGSNIPVFNFVTSQYTANADPVTYTDGTTGNIHDIVTMVLSSGTTTGSQAANYADCIFMKNLLQLDSKIDSSIATEVTNRNAAIAAVGTGWQNVGNAGVSLGTVGGGTVSQSGTTNYINWVVIGNTIHLTFDISVTISRTPSAITFVLPGSNQWAASFSGTNIIFAQGNSDNLGSVNFTGASNATKVLMGLVTGTISSSITRFSGSLTGQIV